MTHRFDANRRLAEIALWVEDTSQWLEQMVKAAPPSPANTSAGASDVTFHRRDLELLASGMRGVARALMGIAQPAPPPLPAPPPPRCHLHVVR